MDLIRDIWPKASHGAVLVTSRNPSVSVDPASGGLEIKAFRDQQGSEIILRILGRAPYSTQEQEAAQQLSARLGGLALTLVVMAFQIRLRGMTIAQFLEFYKRYSEHLHKVQPGLETGSKHPVERSWDSIFDYLRGSSPDAAKRLGVMAPDRIPKSSFTQDRMPNDLEFCKDEWRYVSLHPDIGMLIDVSNAIKDLEKHCSN